MPVVQPAEADVADQFDFETGGLGEPILPLETADDGNVSDDDKEEDILDMEGLLESPPGMLHLTCFVCACYMPLVSFVHTCS